MTQVKMPQPVGYLYQTGPFKIIDLRLFDDIPYNTTVKGVITTTQAEAYAEARVRGALKKVMAATERFQDSEAAGVERQIQDEIKMIMEDNQ